MRRLLHIVFSAVLLALLPACEEIGMASTPPRPTSSPTSSTGFIEYVGSTFSLQVPARWKQSSNQQFQALFIAPSEQNFSANLGVSAETVISNISLDAIAESAKKFQSQDYGAYTIVSEQRPIINQRSAYKRVYSWHDKDTNLDITQIQVFVQGDKTLYTLTATALKSSFSKYATTFETIINSFRLGAN